MASKLKWLALGLLMALRATPAATGWTQDIQEVMKVKFDAAGPSDGSSGSPYVALDGKARAPARPS